MISLKASRKTLSRIPQGGLVHMKQLWRLQSRCRRLQEHMSGVMSVRRDIAPPVPSRQRRGKATTSTHSDWSKKGFQKKELTTYQWLISQTTGQQHTSVHRSPLLTTVHYQNRYREQTWTQRHPRHLCAVCTGEIQRQTMYYNTRAQPQPSPHHSLLLCVPTRPVSYMLGIKHLGDFKEKTQEQTVFLVLWLYTKKYKIPMQESWIEDITNLLPTLK